MRRAIPLLLMALGAALSACGPAEPSAPTFVIEARRELPKLRTWPLESQIQVSWDPTPSAASYTLFWSKDPTIATDRDNATPVKGTTFVHKDLSLGDTYYYYVVALDGSGKEIGAYQPIGDIPYKYEVRRHRGYLAVMPRVHDTFDSLAGRYLNDPDKGWLIQEFNNLNTLTPFRAVLIPREAYEPGSLTDKGYRTVPILTYHQIKGAGPTKMAVVQTEFELQMAYLKRNRYQVITLDQLVDFLEFKGQVPERAVVITFDDGWASTYDIALPILQKYGFKATLFVSTDLIGSNRLALTWQQVRALEQSGVVDIQCHTQSHPNLADVAERSLEDYLEFLENELRGANEVIKKRIRKTCKYLAYPYGATNHLVVAMAQRAGYRAAFTVDRGSNPFFVTNYRVLRSMIFGEYDLQQFAANLEGYSNRVLK